MTLRLPDRITRYAPRSSRRPGRQGPIIFQLAVAYMHTGQVGTAEEYCGASGPELQPTYDICEA